MLRFEYPHFFYLFFIFPLILVAYFIFKRHYLVRVNSIIEDQLQNKILINFAKDLDFKRLILLILVLTTLILALVQPQLGTRMELVKRKGVDIIIALDVSKSMLSTDIAPSRLAKAKKEIKDLMEILEGDRLGIVCFSGDAFVQVPLTVDYAAVEMFLNFIEPEIIPRQGTAISKAISLSLSSFKESEDKYKVILLMTDGEDHEESETLNIVDQASERNIKIYTIGFGSPEGSLIPELNDNGTVQGYKKDKEGNYVTSKLNEDLLREIADKTGGQFYFASSRANELDYIYKRIQEMEKKKISEREFTQYEDRFQIFIGIAIFLLIAEFFVFEKKVKKKYA